MNSAKYAHKAAFLDYAVIATLVATFIALVAQVLVALKVIPVGP